MEEWILMFRGVQAISRFVGSVEEGLTATVELARNNPAVFPSEEFWNVVQHHISEFPVDTIIGWAEDGLKHLSEDDGWGLLLLDLGDCPETFRLYTPGKESLMDEQRLRQRLFSKVVIGYDEIVEQCIDDSLDEKAESLFYQGFKVWTDNNVSALDDELLVWTNDNSMNYHGNSGYLLWLALSSLAILDPLRDAVYCSRVLHDRQRIYLLVGYEEIFFYLATITHNGLLFEEHPMTSEE